MAESGIGKNPGDAEKCGEWRLLKEIGRGSYGVVFLGVAPDGRRAAVVGVFYEILKSPGLQRSWMFSGCALCARRLRV